SGTDPGRGGTPGGAPPAVASGADARTAHRSQAPDPAHRVRAPRLHPLRPRAAVTPRLLRTESATAAYTRYDVTYRSDELTVSGVLIRPKVPGPFPGIVLNHRYIEPSYFLNG